VYKLFTLVLMALLVMCLSVVGQITVSTNNYLPAPGTTVDYHVDGSADSVYVTSLMAGSGGPMTWNFSARTYGLGQSWLSVTPADVPSIDSFPTANMALFTVNTGDSIWELYSSLPTSFSTLGSVSHYSTLGYVQVFQDVTPEYVFPITYNSSWTSHRLIYQNTGYTYSYTYDTTHYTVDAWGTATYGTNSVPCLRVTSHERILLKSYDNLNNLLDTALQTIDQVSLIGAGNQALVSGTHSLSDSFDGFFSYATTEFLNSPTDVQQINDGNLPTTFNLSQNYPNPFNPTTEINLSLPSRSHVNLTIYDILGRQVDVLIDKSLAAGSYAVSWDGKDQSGMPVASGVYLYKLTAGDYSSAKKMVLLK